MDPSLIVACLALALGSIAQRTVGLGFGLVVTPLMVLALGPLEAVLVVNVFGTVACMLIMVRVWRDIDWRGLAWLVIPAVALTLPGVLLARAANPSVLNIAVGVLALFGVLISVWFTRSSRKLDGPATRIITGAVAGTLNGSVGMAAPALGIFGIIGKWEHRVYAATLQPFWVVLSTATVITRQVANPEGSPSWPWWGWLIAAIPILGGIVVGDWLAKHVDHALARRLVIVFTALAGVAVLVSGIVGLIS